MLIFYCTAPALPTSRLGARDLDWIYNLLRPHANTAKWTQLAQGLGLNQHEISAFEQSGTNKKPHENMLSTWLGQSKGDASGNMDVNLHSLLKAMNSAGIEVNQ